MNEIVPRPENAASPPPSITPMELLDRALAQGAAIEVIEKFMGMQERHERNQARRAFDAAIADAKAEIPVIIKNRQVGFDARKPGAARTDYWHEDLAEIARTIDPILGRHGLGYRFRTTSLPNEPIVVTCILFHRDGHSEENTLTGPRDESGNKNSLQAIGSTQTYLQRYTLRAALGLASARDDDGKAAGAPAGVITAEQVEEIKRETADFSITRMQKVLEYFAIDSLAELPAAKFDHVMRTIKHAKAIRGEAEVGDTE